jgi:hypothetical protein
MLRKRRFRSTEPQPRHNTGFKYLFIGENSIHSTLLMSATARRCLINFDHAETKFLAWTRQMVCVSFCQNESDEITMAARIGATPDWAAPRKRPAKRRRHTAYHEASHAVIGRVLTLYCEGATIKPDYVAREAGHAICRDHWDCLHEWDMRGKVRDNADAVWHARIITYMAGVEGEMALLGATNDGDGDDRYQIEMMAEQLSNCKDWNKLEPRLRAMTRMLVRRHQALIERVANTLLRKTTLSGVQLDRLIGRSVNDVKINAPWLLAIHRQRTVRRY